MVAQAAAAQAAAHEDPLAMIGLMVREGRTDAVVIKPPWCLPPLRPGGEGGGEGGGGGLGSNKLHEFDQHRLEEDLSSSPLWGGDERGALRDWNEEVWTTLARHSPLPPSH
jgi:hypothetical protein